MLTATPRSDHTRDDVDDVGTQQGLTTGQAHRGHTEVHSDADQAQQLLVAEHVVARQPGQTLGGHAVGAAQ
jgi:hypothetical protein